MLVLLICAVGIVLFGWVYVYFFTDFREKVKNVDDFNVLLFSKLGLIGKSSDIGVVNEARTTGRHLKARIKIYITLWQIVSLLPFTLGLSFPNMYSAIASALNVFNLGISTSSLVTCSADEGYDAIDALVVSTVYPVVVVFLLKVAGTVHMHAKSGLGALETSQLKARYFNVFLVFTYLILPFTSVQIFQTFSCQDVDPDDVDSGDDRYMTVDYSVSCSSSKYEFGFIWAIVSILVYPVGIPAYYFYILYSVRHDIMSRGDSVVSEVASGEADVRLNPIRLLYEYYRPELWFWEVVETLNRLFLTGVLVVIAQGSAVQILVGLSAALFFIKLCDVYRPFVDDKVQIMKEMSLWQIFLIFLLALLLKADFNYLDTGTVDAFFVLTVFSGLTIDILQTLWFYCTRRFSNQPTSRPYINSNAVTVNVNEAGLKVVNPLAESTSSCLDDEGGIGMTRVISTAGDP